jgi:hypothetical protein
MNRAILKVISFVVVSVTSFAWAQQEQRLQYKFAAKAGEIVGNNRRPPSPRLSSDPPKGVELPKFEGEGQVFTKWPTPMAKNGFLWIALDRSQTDGPLDRLFIDSNGNGHLDDEVAVKPNRIEESYLYFGPVEVILQGEDGPIAYHFNFEGLKSSPLITLSSGGWYEGEITAGSEKVFCTLIDFTVNGTFNDMSPNAWQCDRIRIGKKGEGDMLPVSEHIQIDGKVYRSEIAQSGGCIKLTTVGDVKYGSVKLPDEITEVATESVNGLFIVSQKDGVNKLPIGKHRIIHWIIEREDEKGVGWALKGNMPNDADIFEVSEGIQTVLSVGEPVISNLIITRKSNDEYSFDEDTKGPLGESLELTRNGVRSPAPKLHIKNQDGSYDRTFTFEYG